MNDILFGDTVTLYNHYRANREDCWQRTVLQGVQYREKVEKSVDATGLHLARSVSLTIPVDTDAGGRHYLPPALFQTCEHRENYYTLNAADNLDVLVTGRCEQELGSAYTLDDLQAAYGYTTVKAVADNTLRPQGKHWKVTAV